MQLQTSVADSSAQMAETLKAIQESLALQRDQGVQVRCFTSSGLCENTLLFSISASFVLFLFSLTQEVYSI